MLGRACSNGLELTAGGRHYLGAVLAAMAWCGRPAALRSSLAHWLAVRVLQAKALDVRVRVTQLIRVNGYDVIPKFGLRSFRQLALSSPRMPGQ